MIEKDLHPGQDGPAPSAAQWQCGGRCLRCGWEMLGSATPSLERGDRIQPLAWLGKQNWEGEDSANLINLKPSLKPAKMQVNALG